MLASGVGLYVAGGAALWSLPGSRAVVVSLFIAWLIHGVHVCRQRLRHGARASAFLLDAAGGLELDSGAGRRTPISRLPGTVVLSRVIWLRYCDPEGRIGTELFAGNPRRDTEFRRAVVLLRLLAATGKK